MQPEFTVAALAEMMAAADTPYLSPIVVHVSPLATVYEVKQLDTGAKVIATVGLMDGALVIVTVGLIVGTLVVAVVGLTDKDTKEVVGTILGALVVLAVGMMDETAVIGAGIQST